MLILYIDISNVSSLFLHNFFGVEMYSIYADLRDKRGLTDYAVAKSTGVGRSTLSEWGKGKHSPNVDNLKKIAEFFGVSVDYLTTGQTTEKESAEGSKYYFDDNTAAVAQDIFDNPELKALFDAARNCDPEELRLAAEMLLKFKRTNPDG